MDGEQSLPIAGKVSVTRSLIALIEQRETLGIARYGRSLETFNGRKALIDLREELLDAVQYVQQEIMEREELEQMLEHYRRKIDELAEYNGV